MIKYQDYFPKSTLYKCGIEPETKLIGDDELSVLTGTKDEERINKLINDICLNFKKFYEKNGNSDKDFKRLNVNGRVVNMLCDLDIVSEVNKEKYLTAAEQKYPDENYIDVDETRVGIELFELDIHANNKAIEKSEKVNLKNQSVLEDEGKVK